MDATSSSQAASIATAFGLFPYPAALLAPDLSVVAANPAFLELLAASEADCINRQVCEVFRWAKTCKEDFRGRVQHSITEALKNKVPSQFRVESTVFGGGNGDIGSDQWLFTHSPVLNDVGAVALIL